MLTVPVSTAFAEKSFSKLKLIKTYLRSTMSQERLSALSVLSIEAEIAASVSYDIILKKCTLEKFTNRRSRRPPGFSFEKKKLLDGTGSPKIVAESKPSGSCHLLGNIRYALLDAWTLISQSVRLSSSKRDVVLQVGDQNGKISYPV
ncbi:hypothetical protein TNCV_2225311 [Trichonephila clavipes]|nr:hypothetical protein TNCV_2225311 [Trichonephila clavipes]